MPIVTRCPGCQKQVRVPDSLLGKTVRCPTCRETFTATAEGELPAAEPRDELPATRPTPAPLEEKEEEGGRFQFEEASPPRRKPSRRDDDEDGSGVDDHDDDEPRPGRRRRRRDYAPHRGTLILVLGIVSLFFAPIILGPIAWIMGNNDLKEIRAGRMDPEGEGATNGGRICGMISTGLGILGCVVGGLVFFLILVASSAAPKH
jgi:predicted Zn finger-like uncharacterized protein